MTAPRVYKTEAIILKHIKLGEADRILTLYTPALGKIKAVAKGARRPGSKLGGHVELLTHSLLMLARGRNLDIITQSQTINSFLPLKNDLWRVSYGLYVLELVDSFTEERLENQPVFDLLLNTLNWLCEANDAELVLRHFELHLLHHLGYRPQLQNCLSCNSALQPVTNFFSPYQGGVLCPECSYQEPVARPLSISALKVLRLWQECDFATALRAKISPELSSELEQVMKEYITYLLERETRSTTWLDRLKQEIRRIAIDTPTKSD